MTYPEDRWAVVGRAIDRQLLLYGWSQSDLVRASGVSDLTVRPIQKGEPGNRQTKTLSKISRALGWGGEGLVRILEGADPDDFIREHRDEPVEQFDFNTSVDISPEARRQILDIIDAERRKQQS